MKTIPVKFSNTPAMVDDEDYPVLSRLAWRFQPATGYIVTSLNNRHVPLSRFVLGQRARKDLLVIYKNGDHFDNRKENLELWVQSAYAKHTRRGRTCSSKFLGVFRHKAMNKWCIKPFVNSHMICIQYFDDETEAARAYIKAMADYGVHYTLDDLLEKKRHVEDYEPILTGRDIMMAT